MGEGVEGLQGEAGPPPMIDAIGLPMACWDAGARLLSCNEPYLGWCGRPRAELVGRTLAEIYGASAWAAARNAFAGAFAGRSGEYERQLTHAPVAPRWARIHVFPERPAQGRPRAVYTVAFDIHRDVMLREEMEAARKRAEQFTNNIPYPLTYVDRGFVLRFVNKAYLEATGRSPAELIGRHIGDVRGEQRWREHQPYFESALAGEPVQYTRLTRLAHQGPRWMRTSYVPDVDDEGRVQGIYTVTTDVHELTLAQQRLQRHAERDPLTDVLSRRAVMERLDDAMLLAASAPVALFFVDIDGFKAVNDSLGHTMGDRLLVAVARALQAAVRAEDVIGRYGGDEFLVLASVRDAAGGHVLAQHLLGAVRECSDLAAPAHAVSASIGYALAPRDATEAARLLQLADDAMYAAKRAGKNRVMHCPPDHPAPG